MLAVDGRHRGQGPHGRFQVGDTYVEVPGRRRRRRTFVVIAHRFGFAVAYGLDTVLDTPLVSHRCDNPLCQLPDHWRASNHRANGQEYAHRRSVVRGSLSDTRGAGGRAAAIRDAAGRHRRVRSPMVSASDLTGVSGGTYWCHVGDARHPAVTQVTGRKGHR